MFVSATEHEVLGLIPSSGSLISPLDRNWSLIQRPSLTNQSYATSWLQWLLGCGYNTDWLEDRFRLREGLDTLTKLVDRGALAPILDKVRTTL